MEREEEEEGGRRGEKGKEIGEERSEGGREEGGRREGGGREGTRCASERKLVF